MNFFKKNETKHKQYCVIGLGRFGTEVAKILQKERQKITVIDYSGEVIKLKGANFGNAQVVDASNANNLSDIAIQEYHTVIVAVSDFEKSITICSNLRELGVKNIIAKASTLIHQRILKAMGITRTIVAEIESATKIAYQTIYGVNVDLFRFDPNSNNKCFIIEVPVFNQKLWKKTVAEIDAKNKFNFTIIAIKSSKGEVRIPIKGDDIVYRGDVIYVISLIQNIDAINNFFKNH